MAGWIATPSIRLQEFIHSVGPLQATKLSQEACFVHNRSMAM